MKTRTLIEIIIATIGGVFFAIGMCMCLMPKYGLIKPGVIMSAAGIIILLAIIPIYLKGKDKKAISGGTIVSLLVGLVGALALGFGMSRIMTGTPDIKDFTIGIVSGIIGLMICILNCPVYLYLKSKKNEY